MIDARGNTWEYVVNPDAEKPVMLIDKHIGFDEKDGMGIDGSLFARELLRLDSMDKKEIGILICSEGGIVMDGYKICLAIFNSKARVNTCCTGASASISAIIYAMGAKKTMTQGSWLMFHMPFGGGDKSLDVIADSLISMICSRTGKSQTSITAMLKAETFINSDEAKAQGFCDEVIELDEVNKKRLQAANSIKTKWTEGRLILNKAVEKIKVTPTIKKPRMEIKLITNKLKLNPDASEDSIISEIDKIMDRAKKAEEDKKEAEDTKDKSEKSAKEKYDALKAELEESKKDLKDKKEALAALKDQIDKEKKEAKDKADMEEEEDCKDVIKKAQNKGQLPQDESGKTEVLNEWLGIAKTKGKVDFQKMIDKLPINAKARKIEVTGDGIAKTGSALGDALSVVDSYKK